MNVQVKFLYTQKHIYFYIIQDTSIGLSQGLFCFKTLEKRLYFFSSRYVALC